MRIKWIVGQKFFGPFGIYFGNISAQKWFVYKKKRLFERVFVMNFSWLIH